MNKNIIENIVARGGTEGWKTDVNSLTKVFEFDNFEACQAFVMRVSKEAEARNHHPEWNVTDGGKKLNVKLTSHFANNTVTRLDFEMAEAMNLANEEIRSSFRLYPRFSNQTWATIVIASGVSMISLIFLKFLNFPRYLPLKEKEVADQSFQSAAG
jgi:pterin-4a-carbinolamine dehydratase